MDEVVDRKVQRLVSLLTGKTDRNETIWTSAAKPEMGRGSYLTNFDDTSIVVTRAGGDRYVLAVLDSEGDPVLVIDTDKQDSTGDTDAMIEQLYALVHSKNSATVQLLDSLITRLEDDPWA